MQYDILFFNNSTKKDYLFQEQIDSADNGLYHKFENLDLSGLPSGEYTSYIVRNEYGTAVTWTFSDVPLNDILTYEGIGYKLEDLKPDITLVKVGTDATQDTSTYKKKDTEYYYRKRK